MQELNELFEKIKSDSISASRHSPEVGLTRNEKAMSFLLDALEQYHTGLGISKLDLLTSWERVRGSIIPVNFYQKSIIPDLEKVAVFETLAQFNEKFPSHKSICPRCEGVSTDYYQCNSGKTVKGNTCNWIANSAFSGMKGIYIFMIKEVFEEFPVPNHIFIPIELHQPLEVEKKLTIKKMV